jgi:hypothetical protein
LKKAGIVDSLIKLIFHYDDKIFSFVITID